MVRQRPRNTKTSSRPVKQRTKKQRGAKLSLYLYLRLTIKIFRIMSIFEKVPITNLEKWLNRIVTVAIAVYEILSKLITNWQ